MYLETKRLRVVTINLHYLLHPFSSSMNVFSQKIQAFTFIGNSPPLSSKWATCPASFVSISSPLFQDCPLYFSSRPSNFLGSEGLCME